MISEKKPESMLNLGILKGEEKMNEEITKTTAQEEEKEPIYFAPKRVSLVSDFASILSWVVLVGFIGDVILQIVGLQQQIKTNSYLFSDLLKEPSFWSYLFTNMLIPLLTGLVFFAVLQAAAVGLNMLLEKDYMAHEAKGN
jgi:hypothetical protein